MIAIAHTPATLSLAMALAEELTTTMLFASGLALEDAVRKGGVRAVIDLAVEEMLASPGSDLSPRCASASKTSSAEAEAHRGDRLTAAAIAGVPQIIAITHFEGTPEALDALGKEIAEKACAARGPTLVLVLAAGAPEVLVQSLRNWIYPPSLWEEIDVEQLMPKILRFIRE